MERVELKNKTKPSSSNLTEKQFMTIGFYAQRLFYIDC